jgi:patatin-related protein
MPETEETPVAAAATTDAPADYQKDLTQEMRFAVVMYGGVSLAIYMNGIAQELLSVVRATAPPHEVPAGGAGAGKTDAGQPSTETVYRKIGKILYHGRVADGNIPSEEVLEGLKIRTRILIDILSGTSAGGINAVFLAKALANDQDLATVRQIWMEEGNIDTLLNDKISEDGQYKAADPKTSLLNSQRMFGKLVGAFEGMETNGNTPEACESRLAKEIDLFVTATDLNGLWTPIQLTNEVIMERVHKLHFRFSYRPKSRDAFSGTEYAGANDFTSQYNPMLAFASRCTSSFPVAFEPMTFRDVDKIVEGLSTQMRLQGESHPFYRFFAEMDNFGRNPEAGGGNVNERQIHFTERPLADGGYLNNKPFSFAVETIKSRNSLLPVRRALLYLDPFPESVAAAGVKKEISFTENAALAASTLPRYQTIREDIERLQQYNREVRRANTLLEEVEADLPERMQTFIAKQNAIREAAGPATPPKKYEDAYLNDMIDEYGNGYIAYHRLSVSTVSDQLADLYAGIFNFNVNSDAVYAIRMLVHSWRTDKYSAQKKEGKTTESLFLWAYDLGYRYRRLSYMCAEIDRLLAACAGLNPEAEANALKAMIAAVVAKAVDAPLKVKDCVEQLKKCREAATGSLQNLERKREELWLAYPGQGLSKEAQELREKLRSAFEIRKADGASEWHLRFADLKEILRPVTDEECQLVADRIYAKPEVKAAFAAAAKTLGEQLSQILTQVSNQFLNEVNKAGKTKDEAGLKARAAGPADTDPIARYLWLVYQYFEHRDMIVYQILPDKLTGKISGTEIYRIGPADAKFVYAEEERRAEKLAGTVLMDFGAFLNEGWRSNDMLWGRLDGAERIIESLLPDDADKPLREVLTREATEIILNDMFKPAGATNLAKTVEGFLQKGFKANRGEQESTLRDYMRTTEKILTNGAAELATTVINLATPGSERLELFRSYYSKPSGPSLAQSVGWARRASGILGEMFRGLDKSKGVNTTLGGWIGRVGAVSTNFIEFALPDTLFHKLCWHWLGLLYLTETVLIVVGAVIYKGSGELETAGWLALLLTGAVHLAASGIGRWLGKRPSPPYVLVGLLLLAAVTGLGVGHWRYGLSWSECEAPIRTLVHWISEKLKN